MPQVIAAAIVSAIGVSGTAAALVTAAVNVTFYAGVNAATQAIMAPRTQSAQGRPTQWAPDPDAAIPFVYGKRGVAGVVVHQDAYGADNRYLGRVTVYSGGGPINGYSDFLLDGVAKTFTGELMDGTPTNRLWRQTKLGAQPDTALTSPTVTPSAALSTWGASYKLSGFACSMITLRQDGDFQFWPTGVPKIVQEVEGILCYDPRLDSTYPGGSGTCRLATRSTWVYTRNGAIHALNWTLGVFHNGKQIGGIGADSDHIDIDAFIATANVADANSWYCDAVAYSDAPSGDDKYEVLTGMLQTCGARPGTKQGKISCVCFAANGSSVLTITGEDVIGPFEYDGMPDRTGRINTVIPRRVSETHDWENVDDAPVTSATYVTEDGNVTRIRGIEYPYVTGANQAAQLAAYDIANSREGIAGTITLRPYLRDLDPGECFTLNEAEFGMSSLKCIVLARTYDPMEDVVTVQFRSETAAKHAWALGITGTAPASPSLGFSDPGTAPTPSTSDWTLAAGSGGVPSLVITGAVPTSVTVSKVVAEYKTVASGTWVKAGEYGPDVTKIEITGLTAATAYTARLSYRNTQGALGSTQTLTATPTTGTVAGGGITPSTVATSQLADDAVTTVKVVDGDITNSFAARSTSTLALTTSYQTYLTYRYYPTGGGFGQRIVVMWGYKVKGGTNQTNVIAAYLEASGQVTGDPPGTTDVSTFLGDSTLGQYPPPSTFESTFSWINNGDTATIGAAMDYIDLKIMVKFGSNTNPPSITSGFIVVLETLR